MEDTLLIGDFLFATKFDYGLKIPFTNIFITRWRMPKRGELVIFKSPIEWRTLVKRCIALPGDVVEIKNKVLYVNGKKLDEPYVKHTDSRIFPGIKMPSFAYQKEWEERHFVYYTSSKGNPRDNFGPIRVPPGCIFVLGDNRDYSFDSRFWGPLPLSHLLGRPLIIWWSWDGTIPLWRVIDKIKSIRWKRIFKIVRQ